MAATRNQQPSFDFLTGEASHNTTAPQSSIPVPPSASKSTARRTSTTFAPRKSALPLSTNGAPVRATIDNEALRAQLNTLQYELDTLRSDTALQREAALGETRELERRVEAEYRKASEAQRQRDVAAKKLEGVVREGREEATRWENEKRALDRKARELQDDVQAGREEIEEVKGEAAVRSRESERKAREEVDRAEAAERKVLELEGQVEGERRAGESALVRAKEAEGRVASLEGEVVKLKSAVGDGDMLNVVKGQLGEQVAYIQKLEKTGREMEREVKRLTRERKVAEVVEEEKRVLEGKLGLLDDVRRELAESELRRQVLEDERRAWSAYLEAEQAQGQSGFESPEDLARAFVRERTERVQLMDKLGQLQPELMVKEEAVATLEQEKSKLEADLKKARSSVSDTSGASDSKVRARLERQRNLAVKEVEYLRAQLKSLEDETTEFDPTKSDQQGSSKTTELEALVDQYKLELQSLHTQLSQLEAQPPAAPQDVKPTLKRTHDEATAAEEDERLGTLRRKLRKTTDTITNLETTNATLKAEAHAMETQLLALRESTRTRVLQLNSNPTATHEAIKATTLRTLRDENVALLRQLQSSNPPPSVLPAASVTALQLQLKEKEAELLQKEKKAARLSSIFKAKIKEYSEAIESTLGWKVIFLPGGKLKISSLYYSASVDEETGEEEENYIVFDEEKKTMKISGGVRSAFEAEIRPMVDYWVDDRHEVPLFCAAASLEFWERSTRAQKVG